MNDGRCRLCGVTDAHLPDCDYVQPKIIEWTIKVILTAVELIRDPNNWVRGRYTVDANGNTVSGGDVLDAVGNKVPFWDPRAKKFSADMAIARAAIDLDCRRHAELCEWARRRVNDVAMREYRTPFWHVNDSTSHAAVLRVLAATIADLRLARVAATKTRGAA